MEEDSPLVFGPFRVDTGNECLWRGKQRVTLAPKAFAVLCYLLAHSGRVVRKAEFFDAVWPKTVVSDIALAVCIREIRKAVGDDVRAPRFIETVHRRGYRFMGKVVSGQSSVVSIDKAKIQKPQLGTGNWRLTPPLVGRDSDLAQLHAWFTKALQGERQLVFVTGEPGIGKTSLVEAFLQGLASTVQSLASERVQGPKSKVQGSGFEPVPNPQPPTPIFVGHGQCIEHHGTGEAFLPILDAVGRLCRGSHGEQITDLLRRHAPMWLVQMPALLEPAEYEALQRKVQGASRERMLRELAEALEALTVEHSVVLVLEDLHWSDVSTLDLLAFMARRREPARLLVIGTYRPVEMLTDSHPLKGVTHELFAHDLGKELALSRLSEADVAAYLTLRFPASVLPTRLGQVLYHRTGGNPLFLIGIVQDLLSQGIMYQADDGRWVLQGDVVEVETRTPKSVRHVLARQRERLTPEVQQVLQAASLAGLEFSAAEVAAALETESIQVEEHCGRLAEQQQFLRLAGMSEWPDGTQAARYGFLHALYQEFWHERVSVGKRQQWHLRMGERKEGAYGNRAGEIAAELALHFEQGRDYRRATRYLQQAAENALRKSAYQEAVSLATRGLQLLPEVSDTPERVEQELRLQLALGAPSMALKGYSAPEVEQTYTRALTLCRQIGETPQLFSTLAGLVAFHLVRGKIRVAREMAENVLRIAQRAQNPVLLQVVHYGLGEVLFHFGELSEAQAHLDQAIALYDPQARRPFAFQNTGVTCLCIAAYTLWVRGYPDQALQRRQAALTLAQELLHPFSLGFALQTGAHFHLWRRNGKAAQEQAEALLALAQEQGFRQWETHGVTLRGGALAEQGRVAEGITQIRQGLAFIQALGAEIYRPYFLTLLAAAYGKAGRGEEGLSVVAEALAVVDKTEIRVEEAELYRLKGELTLQQESQKSKGKNQKSKITDSRPLTPDSHAEACFLKAIAIARQQQAKSWELRASTSLARLWQQQGKTAEAHQMLSAIYGWFTEGFDTKDLQEAKALLDSLESRVKTGLRFNAVSS